MRKERKSIEEKICRGVANAVVSGLAVLMLLCLVAAVFGCTSTKKMTREDVDITKNVSGKVDKDVVILRDSVFVGRDRFIYAKGDTVFVTDRQTEVREKLRVDTLYRERTDTLLQYRDRIIEKVVTKNVPFWDWIKIFALGGGTGILMYRLKNRLKRN